MSAKPRLTLLGLFSLFTLLGLVALPGRATAAATLTVSSPGSITTDSRPTITVNLTGSTTGDTITLSLQGGSGTLTSTGNGGSNTANTTGDGAYTFTTAHVDKPGAAYTLTAKVTAGPDLNAFGTSAPFAVTAGAAANVVFTTQPSNAASGAAIAPPVVVHAVDADVNSVPGAAVTLALTAGAGRLSGAATQLTDGMGTATFAGLSVDRAGAGKQLTATSGGAPPTASNAFAITAGTPTAISFTQQPGNAASGAAITPPVVVHAADAANNPVPGVSVVLTKKSGPGTVGGTLSQATDASGNATFGNVSANLVGTYQLTATDAADSLTIDSSAFMVTSGTAAALSFTQQPIAGAVFASGAAIAPIYKVLATDASGNPVPGAAVTLALTAGAGRLSGAATQLTDGTGIATFAGLSVDRAGAGKQLTATSGGAPPTASNAFAITAGTPTAISFTQQPTNALPNAAISPSVKVQLLDAASNPVPGVPVVLSLSGGSGTLTVTQPQSTDATGIATFTDASVNAAGTYQLTAGGSGLTVASSIFTITTGTATSLTFTTQPSNAASGAAIAPSVVVHVADAANNAVPGVSVALTKKSGPGTVGGTLSQATDASGNATFGNVSANLVGPYIVTATSGSLLPVDSSAFTITAGGVANIAFTTQPSGAASGATITPSVVVNVTDTFDNAVAGASVSLTLAPGSTGVLVGTSPRTTDAGGNATFNDLKINLAGVKQLTATSGSLIVNSATFAITAGTPTAISFTQQPGNAASGAVIAPSVVVHVADAANNAVPGVPVALTKKSGPGTVGGTLSQATDASGNATFGNVSANLVGSYIVTATSGSLLPVDSSAFTITAGGVAHVALAGPPIPATQTTDGNFALTAVVTDSQGNKVANATVSLALVNAADRSPTAAGLLTGGTAVSDANGNANFILKISKVGVYQFIASSGGFSSIPSAQVEVTIIAGTPVNLVFAAQPSNVSPNTAIKPSVAVTLTDTNGNPVPGSTISISLSNGTGTLSGTTLGTTDETGRATFGDLSIDRAGAKQITAKAGTLSVASSLFTVSSGTPSLSFIAPLGGNPVPSPIVADVAIAPPVQVQLQDAAGNPFPGSSVTLTLTNADGSAVAVGVTLGGTTTQATDASGVATFSSLTVNRVGNYLLAATAVLTQGSTTTTITALPRSQFTVSAGPVANIAFTGQPTDTAPGAAIKPSVAVKLRDAFGNLVPGASVSLRLAAGSTAILSIASGNLTLTAGSDGTATFKDLSINLPGQYQLVASSGTAIASSANFFISNSLPTITKLSASTGLVHVGDPGFTLAITGTGFFPASTVTFNGKTLSSGVAINDSSDITAFIPASLISAVGSVSVVVISPASQNPMISGTASSASYPFLVLPLGPSAYTSGAPHLADLNNNVQYFDPGLQLFSVPFDYTGQEVNPVLADLLVSSLMDMLSNSTLAVWDPARGLYGLTDPGNAGTNAASSLVLGRGYWARFTPKATNEVGLKTRGLDAKSLTDGRYITAQNLFQIPLKAGWNMIGDPFAPSPTSTGSVKLSDIQVQPTDAGGNAPSGISPISLVTANNQALVSSTLYRYSLASGSMGYVALLPIRGDILAPYVGYWVLAYQPCTLLIPSP